MKPTVENVPQQQRFEVRVDADLARLDYRVQGGVMTLVHTEVPPALEGRGIAGALVQTALDHAGVQKLKVDPVCSYARSYIERHPESRALLS
ncbi:MAG: N-acetyltransferase [Pseudomonadota bacterium]|nr:N-acetyltransferase [Pseudomonadota bacterium]